MFISCFQKHTTLGTLSVIISILQPMITQNYTIQTYGQNGDIKPKKPVKCIAKNLTIPLNETKSEDNSN